ncbi:transporter substrate-binding domain-containing protein [Marinobacter sp. DUT-3]|uniref:transporter substrate-binding domain-containing protein n=1 Tax=Marinobacter sp. DUT-3 TaxID=3412036 RepID=UPI003D186EC2
MSALSIPLSRPRRAWYPLYCVVLLALLVTTPVRAAPPVSIGIVSDNQPYSSISGREASGFSIDILKEVEHHSGLTFEYRAGSWPELYSAFMRGELDAIDGISFSRERAKDILFTDPYHVRQTYLMHDTEKPIDQVSSLQDLKALTIGVVRDVYYRDLLLDNDINVKTYDSLASQIRALAFGWVDAIIGPALTLKYSANQLGFRFLDVAGPAPLGPLSQEDFRIGVLKSNQALFDQIQAGLEAVPQERIDTLLERWQEYGGARLNEAREFSISTADQLFLRRIGPVRVGIMRDYAPFSFEDDGRLQGLTVDVLNRIADLTGLQVIPVGGQWSELFEMFRKGEIDVMANMSLNAERKAFTRFTEPYHVIPNVAFTLRDDLYFDRLDELADLTVALGSGIYYEQAVKDRLGENVRTFTSQQAMFQSLADGGVDVVLAALPNGNYWVRELGIPGVRIAGELPLENIPGEDLRFGIRFTLTPLAEAMDTALAAISATEMRTIEDRWLGAAPNRPVNAPGTVTLTDQEQAWLEAREHQLTLCVDPDWMPLEGLSEQGRHIGLSAEVFRLFAERSGIDFDILPSSSWQATVQAVREHRCDILPLAMDTPQRTRFLDFTAPYLQVPNVVIGRIEAPFMERLKDLEGKRIGIVEGYAFSELIRQRQPGIHLVEVASESAGLRLVQQGDLEGCIATLATASHHMQERGLADLKVIGRIPADWTLSVATRNDEPILLSIMQKLVASLSAEERQHLDNQWRTVQLKQTVDYTLLWQLMVIATVILGLLFYWNRKLGRLNRKLAIANATLQHLSVTDDLTQLGNRSYFDREFNQSFQWCLRHRAGFAVAMVDADHFKRINDTYGHEAGDLCLKALADSMRAHFRRDTDRIARFGGEEFVIFTTYQDRREMIKRLDDFRAAVGHSLTISDHPDIQLTISIGLAIGTPDTTTEPDEFLRQADQALYLAKQNGRNRLEVQTVSK